MKNPIINALFDTRAIRVCSPEEPFWYTSGLFGPYYVNTHFLFGSEEEAKALLQQIEETVAEPVQFVQVVGGKVADQYAENDTYRLVVDRCVETVKDLKFDLISGGERRDFFFSLPVAKVLEKPHLTILKDGSSYLIEADGSIKSSNAAELNGLKVLHVADLVTQASSYLRAWLPAIKKLGMSIDDTLAVVDRAQDGASILAAEGVTLHTLALMSRPLFEAAVEQGLISQAQLQMIEDYAADPINFVRAFVATHPGYLDAKIAEGGKAKERAERLLASDYLK
ncbi:MAG: orotate phosphoribosyltransferase [Fastidiosipilaceae bacterium]|jgi:orotate phosphoribosyltransferase|nr:orotate phosphoribosyltransferase [Clostridiaceae bacterium]